MRWEGGERTPCYTAIEKSRALCAPKRCSSLIDDKIDKEIKNKLIYIILISDCSS